VTSEPASGREPPLPHVVPRTALRVERYDFGRWRGLSPAAWDFHRYRWAGPPAREGSYRACTRRGTFGISGSINSHSSSETSRFAICALSFHVRWTQRRSPPNRGSLRGCSSIEACLCSPGVGSDELYDAEHALLQALQRQDLDTLTASLTDDFVITTAGWIAEPADKPTWLAGLAEHQLDEFELRLLAVRRYDNVSVVLAESAQKGSRSGERWEHTFRYTDVWLRGNTGWLLAVRHASIVRPA
jgi:ketosteroid isomerase-like protein